MDAKKVRRVEKIFSLIAVICFVLWIVMTLVMQFKDHDVTSFDFTLQRIGFIGMIIAIILNWITAMVRRGLDSRDRSNLDQ